MRISDWSSDVCSSDLRAAEIVAFRPGGHPFGAVPQQSMAAHRHAVPCRIIEHRIDAIEREARRIGPQRLPFELVLGHQYAALALEQRGVSGVGEAARIGAWRAPAQLTAERRVGDEGAAYVCIGWGSYK